MGTNLSETLEPIAQFFRSLNLPEPIIHWGHPVMMGIVVLVMGGYSAWAGWRGRLAEDKEVALKNRADHRKLMPLVVLFMTLGATGGILSLVMQKKSILESPHFLTGMVVLGLLYLNGAVSLAGFGGNKPGLRLFHAYLGTAIAGIVLLHGVFGIMLGLSI
ncbi:DUF4079 domain-containing protein [Cyanobacteria bacterium FACHB-DQ100]|nr:DUF4079 domain-containing protein [Cyanobacteria bacterium FACHB-DQ100]